MTEGVDPRESHDSVPLMTLKEFQELGFLQEVNRLFLHPHGLALQVSVGGNGDHQFAGIWDVRNDPEGIVFNDRPDAAKARRVADSYERHLAARIALMGSAIQPLDFGLADQTSHTEGNDA